MDLMYYKGADFKTYFPVHYNPLPFGKGFLMGFVLPFNQFRWSTKQKISIPLCFFDVFKICNLNLNNASGT